MKNLRKKLLNKELTIGSWISIDHYLIPDLLGKAGFDLLVIDMEHTTTGLKEMSILIDKIKMNGIVPFVRLPRIDEEIIKKVLDAGAMGLIAPMVKTKADMDKLIEFSFYPPYGKRGVGLFKAQEFKDNFENYCQSHKEDIVIIAQIEHIDAVNNIEEILNNERLDGIMVGPYDLSASMGFPGQFEKDEVKLALEKVISSVRKSSKSLGFHVIEPEAEHALAKIKEGYNFIAFSLDFLFLKRAAENEMKKIMRVTSGK